MIRIDPGHRDFPPTFPLNHVNSLLLNGWSNAQIGFTEQIGDGHVLVACIGQLVGEANCRMLRKLLDEGFGYFQGSLLRDILAVEAASTCNIQPAS